jgi:cytochrome c oxidase subunit III
VTTVTTVDAPPPREAAHARRNRSTAVWGMAVLIMTEATIFAGLLSSYFFLRASAKEWPLGGIEAPELQVIALFTVILLGSSGPMFWAERGIRKGQVWRLQVGLVLVLLMGASFLCFQMVEYRELGFGVRDNAYGSLFYTITGLHGAHVFGGLLMLGMVLIKSFMGKVSAERHVTVQVVGLYWHFVDAVWVFVFTSLYISSHLK